MTTSRRQDKDVGSPPPQDSPGGNTPMLDYSFTLQALMEIKGSIGELTSATTANTERLKCVETELGTVKRWMYIAIGFITAASVLGGFLIDQFGDKIIKAATGS